MNEDLRPPPFIYHERVQIIATAGDEAYGDGELVKGDGLIGEGGDCV
jgi:hypothetical protein